MDNRRNFIKNTLLATLGLTPLLSAKGLKAIENCCPTVINTQAQASYPNAVALGTLINESFANLNNWTQIGAGTFTPSGSGLTISGGTGTYLDKWIEYGSLINSIENWKITAPMRLLVSGHTYFGINSIQRAATLNRSFFGQVTVSAGNYTAGIVSFNEGTGTVATTKAVSAGSPISVNDDLIVEFERVWDTYTTTVTNVTKSTSQVATWTVDRTTIVVPNVSGKFTIFAGNAGSYLYKPNFTVTSTSKKNIKALFLGDSITQLLEATNKSKRYPDMVFANSTSPFEVNAGGNHRINQFYQQLSTINLFNAEYVFMMIGGNDMIDGTSSAVYGPEYEAIRDSCVGIGSKIVHLTPTARTPTDVTPLRTWIMGNSKFVPDIILDTFNLTKGAGTGLAAAFDKGDGVHPNDLGMSVIANMIKNNIPRVVI